MIQTIQDKIDLNKREAFQERKSLFTQLLAQENLTVNFANVKTASFDVKNRVVTLPIFQVLDSDIYDLMAGHETGHALFTPLAGMHETIIDPKTKKPSGFKSYLNVVEDARIERKVKENFAGLANIFARGYRELNNLDFFELKGKDIRAMLLIDRINLHCKLGHLMMVPFNYEERQLLAKVESTQTFEDVVAVCDEIFEYDRVAREELKKAMEALRQMAEEKAKAESDGNDGFDDGDESEGGISASGLDDDDYGDDQDDMGDGFDSSGESSDEVSESNKSNSSTTGQGSQTKQESKDESKTPGDSVGDSAGTSEAPQKSETDSAFERNASALYEKSGISLCNFRIPEVDVENCPHIVSASALHEAIEMFLSIEKAHMWNTDWSYDKLLHKMLVDFMKEHDAHINLMVNEFEMRRNATTYARAKVGKTGSLDSKRLMKYRLSNDIFKRVTEVPGGKNHGMVLLFDESGSMGNTIGDVLTQAAILVAFGKRVGIPVEVYGFSDNGHSFNKFVGPDKEENTEPYWDHEACQRVIPGEVGKVQIFNGSFHLRQYMTTNMTMREYRRALGNMLMLGRSFRHGYHAYGHDKFRTDYNDVPVPVVPSFMELGGTPLQAGMMLMLSVMKNMMVNHKVEIPSFFMLGDGEATDKITMPKRNTSDSRYGSSDDYNILGDSYYTSKGINYMSFDGFKTKVKVDERKFHSTSWASTCAIAEIMNRMGVRTFSYHIVRTTRYGRRRMSFGDVESRYGYYKRAMDGFFFEAPAKKAMRNDKFLSVDKYPNAFQSQYIIASDALNAKAETFEEEVKAATAKGKEMTKKEDDGKVKKAQANRVTKAFIRSARKTKTSKVFVSKFVAGFAE